MPEVPVVTLLDKRTMVDVIWLSIHRARYGMEMHFVHPKAFYYLGIKRFRPVKGVQKESEKDAD